MTASSPDPRCPNCLAPETESPCPVCGWHPGLDNPAPFLPLGTILDGRYRIARVLGHGGFGITYLAWDENLALPLAIKEYLPRDCATRAGDRLGLSVYSGKEQEIDYGLTRFLDEARALAQFDRHPGIVGVKNFFRAHDTGYIVMEYVEGVTLKDYLAEQGGRIPFDQALALLMPVMDALRAVHKGGLLHRDIAPDNIRITTGGQIKLIDFGAARHAAGEHSRSLSVILKPGYAPEEQYRSRGRQGPWTDVYALCATLYRAITGTAPAEALDRAEEDDLIPPSRLGIALPPGAEAALLAGLAVKATGRTQDIATLQRDLQGYEASSGQEPATGVVAGPQPEARADNMEPGQTRPPTDGGDSRVAEHRRPNRTFTTRLLWVLPLVATALVALVYFSASTEDDAPVEGVAAKSSKPRPIPRPTMEQARNLTYMVSEGETASTYTLSGGETSVRHNDDGITWTETAALSDDDFAFGDMNGDGVDELAVILIYNTGGSATWEALAVISTQSGAAKVVATKLLGDRAVIKDLLIKDKKVILDMLVQGPNDAMCCPTKHVHKEFRLTPGGLVNVR